MGVIAALLPGACCGQFTGSVLSLACLLGGIGCGEPLAGSEMRKLCP